MIDRRTITAALLAGAATSIIGSVRAQTQSVTPARNVVLVHGLFADGSCWSDVIARLQPKGIQVTAVQNPLTTLDDAVTETQRVLDRQDGPTVRRWFRMEASGGHSPESRLLGISCPGA